MSVIYLVEEVCDLLGYALWPERNGIHQAKMGFGFKYGFPGFPVFHFNHPDGCGPGGLPDIGLQPDGIIQNCRTFVFNVVL